MSQATIKSVVSRGKVNAAQKLIARKTRLEARRDRIEEQRVDTDTKIAECVDNIVALLQDVGISPRRGRPRKLPILSVKNKKMTLTERIRKVMPVNKKMQVKDIAQACLNEGHLTKNKNFQYFSSTISLILRSESCFKKTGRGVFCRKIAKRKAS